MLLPYRVKNPTKHFPIATLGLIGINAIVYALTTEYLLVIREDVVKTYGFALGATPPINFITATFLHADPFHLIGNMLYLWVFGRAVEDRLRIPLFLVVYFLAGVVGDLAQAGVDLGAAEPIHGIGASGCIMGILGAYWYLFSWSPVCVFYWLGWYLRGTFEIAAVWIIALYVLLDVTYGMLYSAVGITGGVAHFAHVGGAAAGAVMCLLIRVRRDTEAVSEAKAALAEAGDLSNVPLHDLQTMSEEEPDNPDIIRAMIKPAVSLGRAHVVAEAMARAGASLLERDPELVAYYLAEFKGDPGLYQPVQILRLGSARERAGDPGRALKLYYAIVKRYPDAADAETALCRMAQIYWKTYHDAPNARRCIEAMLKRFPDGSMASFGESLLRQMSQGA